MMPYNAESVAIGYGSTTIFSSLFFN